MVGFVWFWEFPRSQNCLQGQALTDSLFARSHCIWDPVIQILNSKSMDAKGILQFKMIPSLSFQRMSITTSSM